jgi:hypothetical protein
MVLVHSIPPATIFLHHILVRKIVECAHVFETASVSFVAVKYLDPLLKGKMSGSRRDLEGIAIISSNCLHRNL